MCWAAASLRWTPRCIHTHRSLPPVHHSLDYTCRTAYFSGKWKPFFISTWWWLSHFSAELYPGSFGMKGCSVRVSWHSARTCCMLFQPRSVVSTRALMKHLTFRFNLKCRLVLFHVRSKYARTGEWKATFVHRRLASNPRDVHQTKEFIRHHKYSRNAHVSAEPSSLPPSVIRNTQGAGNTLIWECPKRRLALTRLL